MYILYKTTLTHIDTGLRRLVEPVLYNCETTLIQAVKSIIEHNEQIDVPANTSLFLMWATYNKSGEFILYKGGDMHDIRNKLRDYAIGTSHINAIIKSYPYKYGIIDHPLLTDVELEYIKSHDIKKYDYDDITASYTFWDASGEAWRERYNEMVSLGPIKIVGINATNSNIDTLKNLDAFYKQHESLFAFTKSAYKYKDNTYMVNNANLGNLDYLIDYPARNLKDEPIIILENVKNQKDRLSVTISELNSVFERV